MFVFLSILSASFKILASKLSSFYPIRMLHAGIDKKVAGVVAGVGDFKKGTKITMCNSKPRNPHTDCIFQCQRFIISAISYQQNFNFFWYLTVRVMERSTYVPQITIILVRTAIGMFEMN